MHSISHILVATIVAERRREAKGIATHKSVTRRRGVTRSSRLWVALALAAAAALGGSAEASALAPTTSLDRRHVKLPHGDCGSFTLIFDADVTR